MIDIRAYRTPEQFRLDGRQTIFPSPQSLDWNMKIMMRELREAGAVILIAGKRMILPEAYDKILVEYSIRREAQKESARQAA